MPSIYECMSAVLVALGDPRANCPNEFQLLQQVCVQTRTVLRAKRNSGNPWNFADTNIETQPDESLYQITALNFGTPLAVVTFNDFQDPNFVVRRIPFYTAADFSTMEYGLPQNATTGWGATFLSASDPNHSALRCNITWRNNVPYIEFLPVGNQQATYTIRYLQNANGVDSAALSESPVPAEDSDLIILRAAKSLLPLAQWEGNNDVKNQAMRVNLGVSLAADERLAWEQFNASNLVVGGPQVKPRWSPVVG